MYLEPKSRRGCPSALLDLVLCTNITFAPLLTSAELGFNSHPTTANLFWSQVPLENESLLYFAMLHSTFQMAWSPSCHGSLFTQSQ